MKIFKKKKIQTALDLYCIGIQNVKIYSFFFFYPQKKVTCLEQHEGNKI